MKYPIDPATTESFFGHLISHDRAQREFIKALSGLLKEAMGEMGANDTDWYREAKSLFKIQANINMLHENRLFDAKNGHQDKHTVTVEGPIPTGNTVIESKVSVPGVQIDPETNVKLNEAEKEFGAEMTEEELARMFGEKPKKNTGVDLSAKNPFKGMTLEQIEEWEAKQNNSNDIYKIKARVQNLAVGISGGNLTPVGEMMANTFVHLFKDLYDFAEAIPDKELKIALIEKIRVHEAAPGNLISAAMSGVKGPKK
jgi:hypothetical protein